MLDQAHADMYSLKQQLRDTQLALVDSQHNLAAAAGKADSLRMQLQNLQLLQQQQGEQQQKQQQQQAENMASTPATCKAQVGCLGLLALPSSSVAVGIPPLSCVEGWT
jgi:transcriptional antiterminator